ncbi:MAG: hypothetical protein HKO94_12115 [Flavobacteriaceae bacterium]|nr:hypothetical protein [Flavobacteriaceae bacterium]
MKRNTILRKTAALVFIFAAIVTLNNCTTTDDEFQDVINNPTGSGNCLENGARDSEITGNHGHSVFVSAEDIEAGAEKTYNIQGTGDHNHQITITEADFLALKNNNAVSFLTNQTNGHEHSVSISCNAD